MASSRDIDFLIYAEHLSRELDVGAILKHRLKSEHGLSAMVVPLRSREYEHLMRYNPKVLVMSGHFWLDKGWQKWQYYWPNAVYANLAYEQVFQKVNAPFKKPRTDWGKTELFWSAWGDFYRDYLIEHGVDPKLITINGNPSYSLYREPYRRMYPTRAEMAERHGLDANKRWFLFPENYHAAFFRDVRINEYVDLGVKRETAEAFREFGKQSVKALCEWMVGLPPDVEFILRPRPANGPIFTEAVKAQMGEIPENLHITFADTARDWILTCDAVASSYSTTLIEASMAGKEAYMVQTVPFPEYVMNDWYSLVDNVCTQEDFHAAIAGTHPGGQSDRLREWAEREMMAGGDPFDHIINWLVGLRERADTHPKKLSDAAVNWRGVVAKVRRVQREIRHKLTGREEKGPVYDRFLDSDVYEHEARWAKLLSGE